MPERIEWQAPEFDYFKKKPSWYALVVAAGAVLIAFAIWQKNLLFVVFALVAVMMTVIWGRKKPKTLWCQLDSNSLKIGGRIYQLQNFSGFYIDREVLVLKEKGLFGSYLKVKIDPAKYEQSKKIAASAGLPEMDYDEPLFETIGKWLGF